MKLGDLGRSLGQIITAIGTKAAEDVTASLTKALAAELTSMDQLRRRRVAERLRREIASSDYNLPAPMVKRLDGLVTHAIVEGRAEVLLAGLDAAAKELNWPGLMKMAFLHKVVPEAKIAVSGVSISGLSLSTPSSEPVTGPAPSDATPAALTPLTIVPPPDDTLN